MDTDDLLSMLYTQIQRQKKRYSLRYTNIQTDTTQNAKWDLSHYTHTQLGKVDTSMGLVPVGAESVSNVPLNYCICSFLIHPMELVA